MALAWLTLRRLDTRCCFLLAGGTVRMRNGINRAGTRGDGSKMRKLRRCLRVVFAEPLNETTDPLIDRRLGPEPHGALEIRYVCISLRDVAWLHREQFPDRWLADGFLDQPHDLAHLDRLAVADVVDVPRCAARSGIGRIPGPDGI